MVVELQLNTNVSISYENKTQNNIYLSLLLI